jgi:gas vesicle protein
MAVVDYLRIRHQPPASKTAKTITMKPAMKIFTALAVGMAAGAVAGMLLAPRKGEETRKLLRRKGEKMVDEMKFNIRKGERTMANLKEDVEDTINGISRKLNPLT